MSAQENANKRPKRQETVLAALGLRVYLRRLSLLSDFSLLFLSDVFSPAARYFYVFSLHFPASGTTKNRCRERVRVESRGGS